MLKAIIIAVLIMIVAALGSAFYSLVRDRGQSTATVKALTIRVGLSFALFAFIMILAGLGIIEPHG
jgi:drug/metabolite transporter (DMT)-like permease